MERINEFSNQLLDKFSEEITDQVFLFIQNDKELMHQYLNLISKKEIKSVNSSIAKSIKKRYNLSNKSKNTEPKSILIQSFEEFK